MFPLSLRLAGELADGIVTWLVGAQTLADQIVPVLYQAASGAGRPLPKVIAGLPMAVCRASERATNIDLVNRNLGGFTSLPVYEKVLSREQGTSLAGALAAVGDEDTVAVRVRELVDSVDEVYGICFGDEATFQRTVSFLGDLARARD